MLVKIPFILRWVWRKQNNSETKCIEFFTEFHTWTWNKRDVRYNFLCTLSNHHALSNVLWISWLYARQRSKASSPQKKVLGMILNSIWGRSSRCRNLEYTFIFNSVISCKSSLYWPNRSVWKTFIFVQNAQKTLTKQQKMLIWTENERNNLPCRHKITL